MNGLIILHILGSILTWIKKIFITLFIMIFIIFFCTFTYFQYNISKNKPLFVAEEFQYYFEQFKLDAVKYKVTPNYGNLSITFSEKLEMALAYCIPDRNTIVVSRQSWEMMDEARKKITLYHELGHCTLLREHTLTGYSEENTCPHSMMYPYIDVIRKCYHTDEESYHYELFTNPNNERKIP